MIKRLLFPILFLLAIQANGQPHIVHLVLFQLKPGVSKTDVRYLECLEQFRQMPQKISQIKNWSFGPNFSERAIAYDIGLYSTFANKKDLEDYLVHPVHQEAVRALKEIATWHIADYEVP